MLKLCLCYNISHLKTIFLLQCIFRFKCKTWIIETKGISIVPPPPFCQQINIKTFILLLLSSILIEEAGIAHPSTELLTFKVIGANECDFFFKYFIYIIFKTQTTYTMKRLNLLWISVQKYSGSISR